MFEIVFLGTSAAAPSIYRGLSSQIIIANEHRFLVDCGEGTQRQILKSGVGFRRLNRILLTHGHLDHILGLAGLISTFVNWEEGIENIEIFGGRQTLLRVKDLVFGVALSGVKLPIPIDLVTLNDGDIILNDKHKTVSAFPVIHRGRGNFGYIFQQKPHRPFSEERAAALNIPEGPERAELVRGETITLADGRIIHPHDVLGDSIPGIKLVHIGDVGETKTLPQYVQDADCLVIEATYLDAEADIAAQVGHITATQAAHLAKESGVKTLILTHLSRRNSERDTLAEATSIFPDTYVARDFDHFILTRGKGVEKQPSSRA